MRQAEYRKEVSGCCEYGNELLGSVKCEGSLNDLRKFQLLKKDSEVLSYLH